jgi:hypothetical protein
MIISHTIDQSKFTSLPEVQGNQPLMNLKFIQNNIFPKKFDSRVVTSDPETCLEDPQDTVLYEFSSPKTLYFLDT